MKNIISRILFITGMVVIVLGFILPFMNTQPKVINDTSYLHTNFTLSFLLAHVAIGILLIGLSEMIKLLQGLVNHQGIQDIPPVKAFVRNGPSKKGVPAKIKTEIIDFYAAQLIKIDDIQETTLEDIYVVTRGEEKELIELGGFRPIIMSKSRLNKHPELKELLE